MVSFVQNLEKFDDIGVLPEYQLTVLCTHSITHLSAILIRRPVETQNKGSILGRYCDRSRVHGSRIHLCGRSIPSSGDFMHVPSRTNSRAGSNQAPTQLQLELPCLYAWESSQTNFPISVPRPLCVETVVRPNTIT